MICFRTITNAINTLTMKFIDNDLMERYLRGESDAEERHKVLMWLISIRKDFRDKDLVEEHNEIGIAFASEEADDNVFQTMPEY